MASIHVWSWSGQFVYSGHRHPPPFVQLSLNQLSSGNNSLRKAGISGPLLLTSASNYGPLTVVGKRNCTSNSRDHLDSASVDAKETTDSPGPEEIDKDLKDSDDSLNLGHELKGCIDSLWFELENLKSVEAALCNLNQGFDKLITLYAQDDEPVKDEITDRQFDFFRHVYEIPKPEELRGIYKKSIERGWKNLDFIFRHSSADFNYTVECMNYRLRALRSMKAEKISSVEKDCKNLKNVSRHLNHINAGLKRLDANLKELLQEFGDTN